MDDTTVYHHKVYFATFFKPLVLHLKTSLPSDVEIKTIDTRRDSFEQYEVPDLEDDDIASKIEVLYADLPVIAKYWRRLTNLKWAHTAWNGVDILMKSLDKSEALPTFTLTKTAGSVNAALISEYVIGYVISNERCFFTALESQQKSLFQQSYYSKARSISKVTIGILGVGAIGKHLAKVCKSLGMTVWGLTRRTPTRENVCPFVDVYRTTEDLPDLLRNCDYVCNILPSTPASKYLLSGDILSNCKEKQSVFMNVGRGDIIDEESIVKAITNGWLRGAVLDVFESEPLPPTSPLWSLPGVIITPHVSGWSSEESHTAEVNNCFVTNFARYTKGEPLEGVLDWNQGY